MSKVQTLLKNINVINGILALTVAGVAYYSVIPFMNLKIQISLPAVQGKETPITQAPKPLLNPSPADYFMVSEQNLFHPERRIPPEKKEEVQVPRPDLILYGTLITSGLSVAFVEDRNAPYYTPGRGKRQTQLKKGASLNGYVLQDIEANRIVLVKQKDKIVFTLDDKGKKRAGETPMASFSPAFGTLPAVTPTPSGSASTMTQTPTTMSLTPQASAPAVAPATLPPSSEEVATTIPPQWQRKFFPLLRRSRPPRVAPTSP